MNTANLTSWKPGQSGNPSGRPKSPLSNARKALSPHEPTVVQAIQSLLGNPDWRAVDAGLKYVVPYLWGKPPEVELTDEAELMNATLASVEEPTRDELLAKRAELLRRQ
jgi:uncharacterized protein DUF5681